MASRMRVITSFKDNLYGFPTFFSDVVEKHFDIVYAKDFENEPKKYKDVVGILVWTMPGVPKTWLDALPNLKVIANVGAGYDKLDVPLIRSYGVKVSNTPDILSPAAADLGMALILAAGRNIVNAANFAKSPEFTRVAINDVSLEVSGQTLGIVGMDRIGFKLAKRAAAFDMKILYHNRSQRSAADEQIVGATYFQSLNEMLPLCDYVAITTCLTKETMKVIGIEQLKAMKKTAVLVNISRGSTVDTDALLNALKTGEIHSAALDVTDPEPLPRDHELLRLPNVIITPHVGSQTKPTRTKMIQLAVDNILAGVNGTELPSEVFQ